MHYEEDARAVPEDDETGTPVTTEPDEPSTEHDIPEDESIEPGGILQSCWIRGVLGLVGFLFILGIVGLIAYQEARDDWSQPMEIDNYPDPDMRRIYNEQMDTRDVQRFVQRVGSGEQQRLLDDIEDHFRGQMDSCDRQYDDIHLPATDSNPAGEVQRQYVSTICYKERTHDLLGFVQYARVRIYVDSVFLNRECQAEYAACQNTFEICQTDGSTPRETCIGNYETCLQTNEDNCQIPAVYIEMERGWDE